MQINKQTRWYASHRCKKLYHHIFLCFVQGISPCETCFKALHLRSIVLIFSVFYVNNWVWLSLNLSLAWRALVQVVRDMLFASLWSTCQFPSPLLHFNKMLQFPFQSFNTCYCLSSLQSLIFQIHPSSLHVSFQHTLNNGVISYRILGRIIRPKRDENGEWKSSTIRNFIVCTDRLIYSGLLNLEDKDGQIMWSE